MFIQLGKFSPKHLLLLLFPLFLKLRYFIIPINENKRIFKCFNDFLGLTLCGIIHLISKLFTRTKKNKDNCEQKEFELILQREGQKSQHFINQPLNSDFVNSIELEHNKKKRKEKKEKFLFILLIAALQIIPSVIKIIFFDKIKNELTLNIEVLMQSLFFIIFSMVFLSFSLYKHQYYSLAVLSICLVIFYIEIIVYSDSITFVDVLESFIYIIIYQILYCLSDVLGKKYLTLYMDTIYLFLFKIGITGLVPLITYDSIAYLANFDDKYHGIIKTISSELISKFWKFLLNLLCYILFEISLWLTIYYFSPCHYIILEVLGNFLEIIFSLFSGKNYKFGETVTFLTLYPILFFSILVFNEIIILNFFGLSYNTQIYIRERAKKEKTIRDSNITEGMYSEEDEDYQNNNENNQYKDDKDVGNNDDDEE